MLNVISNNNDLTQITKLGFSQVGLNAEENQLILSAAPKDQFIRATAEYQLCLDRLEDIDESLRPTTKTYMQGPFVLSMYNLGDDLSKSMLVFDIELQDSKKQESGIIIDDPLDWTSKSLAVFPFVDLFRKEIESEADRLSDFLKKHKVANLADRRAEQEKELVQSIAEVFFRQLNIQDKPGEKICLGREAVSDTLASSLTAQNEFYNKLWDRMLDFYDSSIKHLGEQYALGKTDLSSMAIVKPDTPDKDEPDGPN